MLKNCIKKGSEIIKIIGQHFKINGKIISLKFQLITVKSILKLKNISLSSQDIKLNFSVLV